MQMGYITFDNTRSFNGIELQTDTDIVVRSAGTYKIDISISINNYVSLYLENNTQESLSESLGYSIEYISKLNRKLVKFFLDNIKEE